MYCALYTFFKNNFYKLFNLFKIYNAVLAIIDLTVRLPYCLRREASIFNSKDKWIYVSLRRG